MSNHTWKSVIGGWQRCEEGESLTGPVYPDLNQAWASESMSNHTPGPWYARGGAVYDERGGTIAFTSRGTPRIESEANARLIAKAPQMLTLLRQAVDQFPDLEAGNGDIVDWLVEFVRRAHEVIDKP